jgi:hypothetical protein
MTRKQNRIAEGELCQRCDALVDGKAPGFPRHCANCKKELNEKTAKNYKTNG